MAFFAASWALLAIAGASRMFQDPGTFWHVLTGERILSHGLPREDWLTFTFQGKPWIAHQWLAECAMALLHRLGGFDALLVAASGGLALLFTWLFARLIAGGVALRWAVLISALGLLTSAGSIHIRPMLLSMVFFGWTFALIAHVEAGRAPLRRLWWLVPLFVLWTSCHGAVLGGLATLALAAALWITTWATARPSPVTGPADALTVCGVLAAGMTGTLLNPYGVEMIRTWLAIVRSPVIAEYIVEHASLWRTSSWYVVPLAAGCAAVAASSGRARWTATCVLPLVWLVLMLQRIRHASLFAIAALIALAELLPRSGVAAWLARHGIDVTGPRRPAPALPRAAWLAPVAALALAALNHSVGGPSLAGPQRARWPYALVPRLDTAARAIGPRTPVLTDMVLGAFVAFNVPGVRIFGDDRCELYGDAFLREWYEGTPAFYARQVAEHDVRLALSERDSRLDQYLRGDVGWREVASTPRASLFVRAAGFEREAAR
ncbi:hypothetical protein [Anaeromyxobacter dehalogenans]|uniref:hypothetical protein n=1 Tax=Anaeromyxobacter dehalogenans TaxID=161493 RepID=UPI0002F060BA|nr:hypothetical protein [Anaeromyxobacter dehalogenans]